MQRGETPHSREPPSFPSLEGTWEGCGTLSPHLSILRAGSRVSQVKRKVVTHLESSVAGGPILPTGTRWPFAPALYASSLALIGPATSRHVTKV